VAANYFTVSLDFAFLFLWSGLWPKVETVIGLNATKDFLVSVRNIVGARSGTMQTALRDLRIQVLDDLKKEAAALGADAVVGVDLDYNEIGAAGSTMLLLVATGTAISLTREITELDLRTLF